MEEALPLAEAAHDVAVLAHLHRERGFWIWQFDRDRAGALREYDLALAQARQVKDWAIVITSLHLSGNLVRYQDAAEALRRYQEALPIAQREHWGTAHILKNIGDTYLQIGRPDLAEGPLQQAAEESDRNEVAEIRWSARRGLAIINRERNPSVADRYFSECLNLIEEQQSGVLLEDFRPGVLAAQMGSGNPYDEYIDFLLASNRSADAFFVAERERARVFLEMLSASREGLVSQVPKGYAEAEHQALASLRSAQSALRTAALHDDNRATRIAEAGAAEERLAALRLRLAVQQPSLAHARYPKLWTAQEVQSKLLLPDESLLSVALGPSRSVAWLITRDKFQTFLLPAASTIEPKARAAIEQFSNPLAHNPTALRELSQTLGIDHIADALHQPHLVIVPDGILNDVPFEALLAADGHPLIERFAISYAPSASSLAHLRKTRRSAPHPVELIAGVNADLPHEQALWVGAVLFARQAEDNQPPGRRSQAGCCAVRLARGRAGGRSRDAIGTAKARARTVADSPLRDARADRRKPSRTIGAASDGHSATRRRPAAGARHLRHANQRRSGHLVRV